MNPPTRPQPPPALAHPSLHAPLQSPSHATPSPHAGSQQPSLPLRSPLPPPPPAGFPQAPPPAYPAMRAPPGVAPGMRAPPPKPISAPASNGTTPPPAAAPPGVLGSPASAPFRAPPPPFNPYQLHHPPPITPHFSPPLVHANSMPSAAASAYPNSTPSPASSTQYSPSLGSFNSANRFPSSINTAVPSPLVSPLMSPMMPPPLQTFLPSPTHPAASPIPAPSPMQRTVSSPQTPSVPSQQGTPAPISPPSSGGTRTRAANLPHIQALHLADSTRDYPIMSPASSIHRTPPSQNSKHSSPPVVAPITFSLTNHEGDDGPATYEEAAVVDAVESHPDEHPSQHHAIDGNEDGHEEDHSEHEEEVEEPPIHFDHADLLGRLCSNEKVKADDLPFWRSVMDGMEWAFFDAQSPEVQKLIHQYCKSFVACAARSRNLHAMLLVICRHLENYSQHLHMVAAASAHTSAASSASAPKVVSSGGSMTKDHVWVTSLMFFLRVLVQYILTHLSYEDTLKFFAHLAIPDAASKPNTPKTAIPSYSQQGSWMPTSGALHVPLNLHGSRSPSPHSPRTAGSSSNGHNSSSAISGLATPPSHVAINLNPNSRRSSLNSQTDVLTRFVCAIVNSLEVLGDAKLNQEIASAKNSSSSSSSSAKEAANKLPLSSPSNAALAAAAAASASNSSPPPSTKGAQPLIDLHLELLNTLFVLLSTQMYLPLSTEFEQVFLDRLLYCCKPPMLNSMQGFVTGLISSFTEILPADYATTVFQRAAQNSKHQPVVQGFFSKITSKLSNLFYFPVWAVRYLFTIPPNHPLIDRSTLLLELLVYQNNNENPFREAIRKLKDADPPSQINMSRSASGNTTVISPIGVTPLMPASSTSSSSSSAATVSKGANITGPEDLSHLCMLDKFEAGAISFSKLYYSLCSTLLSEHINLFLYSLIHENLSFRRYILTHHAHDLDYLLMPQLEILYREVDISKHHVYMIINIWILLTQNQGFDAIIKSIRIKEVPFFKEVVLKDLQLTQVMQIVLLRTLQLNLRTKLKEPHIFNNCLAAFCNLTITALIGPTLPTPGNTPAVSPSTTSPTAAAGGPGSATPGSAGGMVGSVLSVPLTLHPQVSFRLIRVLSILSRKFLSLQVLHEQQIIDHNARVELMAEEARDEVTEEEELEEVALEEVAEELGTCMEFIQLLLEVVNHSIVHSLPPPHPLAPPSQVAAHAAKSAAAGGGGNGGDAPMLTSSLASNPHLLYNLLAAKEYFLQLLPYAHLFENNLISNLTNTIAFYEQAPGVEMPGGLTLSRAAAAAQKVAEKSVEKVVSALRTAIERTPMNNAGMNSASYSPGHSPLGGSGANGQVPVRKVSHALPPGSCPSFDPTALIERGPFTYHEQENSQDFFIPYIYQLAQTMKILPRMYSNGSLIDSPSAAAGGSDPNSPAAGTSPSHAAIHATASAMGDVDADLEFIRELEVEEAASATAAFRQRQQLNGSDEHNDHGYDQNGQEQYEDGFEEDEDALRPSTPAEDNSKLRVAIM